MSQQLLGATHSIRQRKTEFVSTRLEKIIDIALDRAIGDGSKSEYLRALVIKDLKGKGLLTDSMLAEMVV